MESAGYTRAMMLEAEKLVHEADRRLNRLRGVAGWLLTEPDFFRDCQTLEQQWVALADECRPTFPLQSGKFRLEALQNSTPEIGSAAYADFTSAFVAFCEKWGLIGMQTWDLPEPQGLLFPNLLPQNSPGGPRHGVHIVVPICFPIQDNDDFINRIHIEQKALAKEKGIDADAAGLPHAEAYARILEIIHLERTITNRYGPARRVPGLVNIIKNAIAEALHLSVEQVEKWRKAISACRRGRRNSVPAFRTRS